MYVRFNVDKLGQIHLEQLLQFQEPGKREVTPKWEKVPVTGLGETSVSLPLGMNCGVFCIEEIEYGLGNTPGTPTERIVNYIISSLSISKISSPSEGRTRIDCHDKKFFFIKMETIMFITLLTNIMNKFQVIKINSSGEITNL